MSNNIFQQLAEDYGLDVILEQNDIEPCQVLELLYAWGLIDVEDYWFKELEVNDEE